MKEIKFKIGNIPVNLEKERLVNSFDQRESVIGQFDSDEVEELKEIHFENLKRIRQNVKETALCVLAFVTGRSTGDYYNEGKNVLNVTKIRESLEVKKMNILSFFLDFTIFF